MVVNMLENALIFFKVRLCLGCMEFTGLWMNTFIFELGRNSTFENILFLWSGVLY